MSTTGLNLLSRSILEAVALSPGRVGDIDVDACEDTVRTYLRELQSHGLVRWVEYRGAHIWVSTRAGEQRADIDRRKAIQPTVIETRSGNVHTSDCRHVEEAAAAERIVIADVDERRCCARCGVREVLREFGEVGA